MQLRCVPERVWGGATMQAMVELSVAEAAERVGVTEEAVRLALRKGLLTGRRVQAGQRLVWRVDAEAVAAWQVRREHTNPSGIGRPELASPGPDPSVVSARPVPADAAAEIADLRRQVEHLKLAMRALLEAS
jgi:hypothetical protein